MWTERVKVDLMPPRQKAAHHRGSHQVTAKRVTDRAYANPDTRCGNCHNTLDKCGPRNDGRNRNGSPCTWQAGHNVAGDSRYGYSAWCSHCQGQEGAQITNSKRVEPHSERW